MGSIPNNELTELVFDCALCGERVYSIPSDFEHFKESHNPHGIDFKALQFVKVTTYDSDT